MLEWWGWLLIGVGSVAVICAVALILILKGKNKAVSGNNSIELVIGEKCVVTETIDNNAGCGQASVNGFVWSARSAYDSEKFVVGEVLDVVAVEGVKLICKKQSAYK